MEQDGPGEQVIISHKLFSVFSSILCSLNLLGMDGVLWGNHGET